MLKKFLFFALLALTALSAQVDAAPTGSLLLPVSGAAYSAPATLPLYVSATPAAGTTITKVEFYTGATLLGPITSSPYRANWGSVPAGTYVLSAKIYDSAGAVTTTNSATVTVYAVDPANTPPTVGIFLPVNNATYTAPANIPLAVNVTDNGGINRVEYYINGSLYYVLGYPYTTTWPSVPAGTYSIIAKAYDNLGVATTSAANTITVYAPGGTNVAPSATLTSPVNNALYTAPASVPMNVTASDSDGSINRVEFYLGTQYLGTVTASPYNAKLSLPSGTYSLWALAYDNLGASTATSASNVTVNALPSVSLTAPANNANYNAPAAVTLTASATDTDGTIAKVEFYAGTTLVGTATTSPYTVTLTNVAAATYNYTAKAYDNLGGITTSAAVSVVVNNPPVSTLSIQTPLLGYSAPATVVLNATASSPTTGVGINKVQFYADGVSIGSVTTSPYVWTLNNVAAGSHTYSAQAFDSLNVSAYSNAVTISVSPGLSPATYQYDELGRLIGVQH